MKALSGALIAVLPLWAVLASAQSETFSVTPNASRVAFALSGTGHEVHGTFQITSGTVHFNLDTSKMTGVIAVSAASGDSGDNRRDDNMHSKVLDVEHYADLTFQPQSYQGTIGKSGDSTIQVSGIFTLHGTPHDITVPMQVRINGSNLTARGSLIVPYVRWGLKDPSVFILRVAKEVHIDLDLVGTVKPTR